MMPSHPDYQRELMSDVVRLKEASMNTYIVATETNGELRNYKVAANDAAQAIAKVAVTFDSVRVLSVVDVTGAAS